MQKLTVTFIYGKDDTRKLKYRLTGDVPLGVMLEKLISFQFIVDSADPKTFQVIHNGVQLTDLCKTFEECEIIDGDEIFLIPTVFDPIPPLPENDEPLKKMPHKINSKAVASEDEAHPHGNRQQRHGKPKGNGNFKRNNSYPKRNNEPRPVVKGSDKAKASSPAAKGETNNVKKDAPVPFKPHGRNFHRSHKRPNQNRPQQ